MMGAPATATAWPLPACMTTSPSARLTPATLLRMTRPGFLAITVVACLLGIAIAAACGHGPQVWTAAATVLLACLAHATGNVLNDYHDALNGADAANTGALAPFTGGARLIQDGIVTPQQTRDLYRLLAFLLAAFGLLLAVKTTGWVIVLGLAGLLLLWAYSAPPLALMKHGLGELVVAAVWSLVVIGADAVQRGSVFVIPVLTSVSYALLVANILLINGLPDAASDARVGKRTLAVLLGPRGAALAYLLIGTLAHAWLAAGVALLYQPEPALWGLLSWPLSLAAFVLLWRHARQPQRLRPAIVLTIACGLLHGLAMAAGFASMARV
jgi:1,4-dihydroxy-2-naphthoate octaprenyltransferase